MKINGTRSQSVGNLIWAGRYCGPVLRHYGDQNIELANIRDVINSAVWSFMHVEN
jgi:hypothetical protein